MLRVLYDADLFAGPESRKAGIYSYALGTLQELVAQGGVEPYLLLDGEKLLEVFRLRAEHGEPLFELFAPQQTFLYNALYSTLPFRKPSPDTRTLPQKVFNRLWFYGAYGLEKVLRRERYAHASSSVELCHFMAHSYLPHPHPFVATVHDTLALDHPEWFTASYVAAVRRVFKTYAQKARRILCVSETTRRDFLRHFPYDTGKIDVVYLGLNRGYYPEPEEPGAVRFLAERGLSERPFWVCLATPRTP